VISDLRFHFTFCIVFENVKEKMKIIDGMIAHLNLSLNEKDNSNFFGAHNRGCAAHGMDLFRPRNKIL